MAPIRSRPRSEEHISDNERVGGVLDALEDEDCRAILEATCTETLSANELSELCDLPLSTAYRKLDELTEVGLLDERIRLSRSGKHTSEYALAIEDITLTITAEDGIALQVSKETDSQTTSPLVAGAD